ncbi:MAG: hypothetical protein V4819_12640 [Verrucomicrobiota bacterium]
MKTNSMTPPTLSQPLQSITGSSRFASFGRLMMATLCISLVSFAATPKALAAAPNGTYDLKDVSGTLKIDGDSFSLPDSLAKRLAGVSDGEITIEDNTLKLRKNVTGRIVEEVADDFDIDVEVDVEGPNKVVLTKTGDTYSGKTASPIVATFEGDVFSLDFSGELITKVAATVEGKTLTVVIRFSGEVEGEDFSGKITLIAKR